MELLIARTIALLGLAMAVAIVARRLALPYTVGLVLTGVALALARIDVGLDLTREIVFDLILPPLLFEAALNLPFGELRRDASPILALSILGTIVSAAVVTAGLAFGLGWPLGPAAIFGALISATDPIAVIALLRESGVKGRLALLIESESLANDGVAAVLFGLALSLSLSPGGEAPGAVETLQRFAVIAGGGVGVGALLAFAALALAGRTDEHLIETAITAVAAYGSFLAAERLGASGVLATATAGLVLGNLGALAAQPLSLSARARDFVFAFWEFAAFLANSFVFLLIGLALARVGASFTPGLTWIVALALAGRAAAVYPVALLFHRSRWRIPLSEQHFLWWGGLRGALALALALTLPDDQPYRGEILVGAFAVVAFSVLFQGLTAGLALKRLGLTPRRGETE